MFGRARDLSSGWFGVVTRGLIGLGSARVLSSNYIGFGRVPGLSSGCIDLRRVRVLLEHGNDRRGLKQVEIVWMFGIEGMIVWMERIERVNWVDWRGGRGRNGMERGGFLG